MSKLINLATNLFPVWAILFAFWSYFFPEGWQNLENLVIPLLSIVMFSMGLTLKVEDFFNIFKKVKIIFLGLFLQFFFMPLIGFLLIFFFNIEDIIALGILLVGCAPGGTASNVICYLAKGNVALSISLTICSTFLSVFFMPILFWLYTGSNINVPIIEMMSTILKIIIFPVALGILLNNLNLVIIKKIKTTLPLIAVSAIVIIIAIIIGSNSIQISRYGIEILFFVVLHNSLGFFIGYYGSSILNLDKKVKRTIAIEVAMQNSGLATAIAVKYFGLMSAVPGAFYSIWHNISGSFIAGYWKRNK